MMASDGIDVVGRHKEIPVLDRFRISGIGFATTLLAASTQAYAHHDEPVQHIWNELIELLSHPEVLGPAAAVVAVVWWLLRRRRNAKREIAH
jgi:hypothetical protein